jgi:hypothetical protein
VAGSSAGIVVVSSLHAVKLSANSAAAGKRQGVRAN